MANKREGKSPARIAAIHTEYVHSLQQKVERKKARKIRLYRRLTVFALIAIVILGVLTHTFVEQKKMLALKEQEKTELLADIKDAEEEHELLTRNIANLNDDEYIAKLARQEYFLSEKDEIIFSMPDEKNKSEKKSTEKE